MVYIGTYCFVDTDEYIKKNLLIIYWYKKSKDGNLESMSFKNVTNEEEYDKEICENVSSITCKKTGYSVNLIQSYCLPSV